jgi:hypothetical protein
MSATFPLAPTIALPVSGKTLIAELLLIVAGILPVMTRSPTVKLLTVTKKGMLTSVGVESMGNRELKVRTPFSISTT